MAQQFIGEIRLVGFNFAPRGWATCAGQLLPINQNEALFTLLGTTFGGDGQTTFALPDFRGRIGVGPGQGPGLTPYTLGEVAGVESHTLLTTHMPAHSHGVAATGSSATTGDPSVGVFAQPSANSRLQKLYGAPAESAAAANAVGQSGGNQPHENMQPYLCVQFVIALEGVFPPRD